MGSRIVQSVQCLHYRPEDTGIVVRFLARARVLFSEAPRLALWLIQPPIPVSAAPFPGGKRSGCEPTYLPPSSGVRNKWRLTSTLYIFWFCTGGKTLHLHNTKIFYTGFCGVGRQRFVFSDEAERCIVGSRASGITSLTSEVLLVDQTACRQISLLRLSVYFIDSSFW